MLQRWAGDVPVVHVMLWSDKMTYDKAGRQTGHPMTISLGGCQKERTYLPTIFATYTGTGCTALPFAKKLQTPKTLPRVHILHHR